METLETKRRALLLTVLLVALNVLALNVLASKAGRARVDLTEDGAFSTSAATERLLASLDDTVTIYGYFSERTHPKLAPLVPRIEDLLREYEALGGGRVHVEIADPGADATVEAEANERFGVRSTPFRLASKYEEGIVNAYFAVVVRMGDLYERYGFDELIAIEALPNGEIDVRLRNLEYDLTRAIKKVASGSRGPEELFARLETPATLIAAFSLDRLPAVFEKVPGAVRDAAKELEERGGEKFHYREIDPARDPEGALFLQESLGANPYALGLGGGASFFLHGFLQVGEVVEPIGLIAEDITAAEVREGVIASLQRRVPGFLRTVGVVVPDPSLPRELLMQLQMQGRQPPQPEFEEVQRALERDYQIERVDLGGARGVPDDVDVLLVIRPEGLDERAVYHVDQYLMRGGRVIVCTGAFKTSFTAQGLDVLPVESGLESWLAHFGVTIEKTLVLDDRNQPLPIPQRRMTPFGAIETWALEPYPYLVEVRDEGLAERQVAARVDAIGLYWASPLTAAAPAEAEFQITEILRSSARSWTDDDTARTSTIGYDIPAETAPRVLGVALAGRFTSAFAGKTAPPPAGGVAEGRPPETPLERSPETRLVVIGNAAFLSDFVARALGPIDGGFFQENLDYTQNLIDWIGQDADLLEIRARGTGARTLTRLSPDEQGVVETLNYAAPVVVLALLAAWQVTRRRRDARTAVGREVR